MSNLQALGVACLIIGMVGCVVMFAEPKHIVIGLLVVGGFLVVFA